jgi:hypothetical protein
MDRSKKRNGFGAAVPDCNTRDDFNQRTQQPACAARCERLTPIDVSII